MVLALMLMSSAAFAANYGLIGIQATVADTTILKVNTVSGGQAPTLNALTVNATTIIVTTATNIAYSTNKSSWQLFVMNASHVAATTNADENVKIDGLVDYSLGNMGVDYSGSQQPLGVTVSATLPTNTAAAAWLNVKDSQYWPWYKVGVAAQQDPCWKADGTTWTKGSATLADSARQIASGEQQLTETTIKAWYRLGFTATTAPATWTAVLQYSLQTQ